MNILYSIYFSPTHTSRQIAEAFVDGIGIEQNVVINLTLDSTEEIVIPTSALAVIVVPVYGGNVAPLAMKRLQNIRGTNTPVALAVVYGNRAYEKALTELATYASGHGFKVIAGATFVGEHSFSSEQFPIAAGRPNKQDLNIAREWAQKIIKKVQTVTSADNLPVIDVRSIRRPRQPIIPLMRFFHKVLKLRKSNIPLPCTPWVEIESRCTHCGVCVSSCPVGAITKGDELHTDTKKCIKCCACVKACNKRARVYDTPFAVLLADCFKKQKSPQVMV